MTNPFHDAVDDHLRGRRVRVVSHDGVTFRGWVNRIHHHDRHVLLEDATNEDTGMAVGATFVSHADTIEALDPDHSIERVHLDDIHPSPYHAGEWSESENRGYVADVRDTGFVGSYPVVRERGEGFEIVEGHKRIWACRQAGLDEHPVRVVDIDDWTATRRFVVDHLPDPGQANEHGTASGYYEGDALEEAILTLLGLFGERAKRLDRVAFNAERLDLTVSSTGDGRTIDFTGVESCVEPADYDIADTRPDQDIGDETGEVLATSEVKSYGLAFPSAVVEHFDSYRVTVREHAGRYELAPGESDDYPDYSVGADAIQIGNPGLDILGAEEGDEIRVTAAGDVAVLEVTGDEDDVDADETEEVRWSDWQSSKGNGSICQNCDSHVDPQFTRVFEPESEGRPRVCPNCEDLIRDGNEIRQKRDQNYDDQEAEA